MVPGQRFRVGLVLVVVDVALLVLVAVVVGRLRGLHGPRLDLLPVTPLNVPGGLAARSHPLSLQPRVLNRERVS